MGITNGEVIFPTMREFSEVIVRVPRAGASGMNIMQEGRGGGEIEFDAPLRGFSL